MMKSIVEEKLVSFKELEGKIFQYVCGLGCEIIRMLLERYDVELEAERDKSRLRNKGLRKTTIKTLCGEVEYCRRIYETRDGESGKGYVYLLDEAMHMEKIGLLSTNLAERIMMLVTEAPYRVTAETISSISGQSISHGGVWNLTQKLGECISREEEQSVRQMEEGKSPGEKKLPVLFEEMDGVWLRMQDRRHKKAPGQELKVSVFYEGWDAGNRGRSRLVGKTTLAGMEKSSQFHEKREAQIRQRYNGDEIGQRILNGDGASWIKDPYDPEVIFQLDRFHIHKAIREKLKDKEAQRAVEELFEKEQTEEMLRYISIYADSIAGREGNGKEEKKARELYEYLKKNEKGLLPYQSQGRELPEPEKGVVYRQMGVQENQNCTVVTLRMKNRRMRWSESGANNMAKVLYRKENRELQETIERHTDSLAPTEGLAEIMEVLSASKAPKKEGKGSPYIEKIRHHMPVLDAMQTASRKVFREVFA